MRCCNPRLTVITHLPYRRNLPRVKARTPASEDLSKEQVEATGDPLEGLNYVLEKEKEIRNRAELLKELEGESTQGQRGRKGRKTIQRELEKPTFTSVVTTPIDEVDETDPQRAPYHNTLYQAAMEGKANEAEDVIREMIGLGIQPGPRAYHGLIFAYAKSNNSSGALNAVRRAHSSGLNPLTESYLVLIHTFIKEQNFKRAESVFRSMTRPDANVDIQAGWNMLTSLLFQNGATSEAETLLEEGRNEEFLPDNKVFTESIKCNCKQGKIDSALEDLSEVLIYELYEEGDLHCTAEQIEPLLHHFATTGDLLMMLWLLQLPQKLTTTCYNSILRSILTQWESKSEDLNEIFQLVWDDLEDNTSVKGDLESMVFYLTAEILRGNVLSAQRIFLQEQLADVKGLQKKQLISDLLSRLLIALGSQGLPIAMHNLLLMLSITNLGVPESAFVPDSRGRTFVTQWLDGRLENIDGEGTQQDEDQDVNFTPDGRRIVIIDGVKIGFGNCVVDDEGEIVPLSSLLVNELRAECKARGLPNDGVRKELYENVKLARRAMPSIKDEIKRKKQLTRKKAKMTGKKIRSSSSKKTDKEPEVYQRVQYRHGKLIKTEILHPEVAVQLLSKPEPGQESDNLDDMNEEEAMIEVLRVGDKPQIPEWSDVFTLTSRQNSNLGTNETAGANAVVAISALLWKLGGIPTLEDFEAMLYVIDQTRNPAAAWKLGNLISQETINFKTERVDPAEKKEEYYTRLRRIMHVCARICLTCGFPDSCEQLVTKMRELEIEPDQVLLQEIVQFREKGVTKLEGKYPSNAIETKPKSKDMVSLVVDPLRPIRTETLLEDEEDEEDGETESELERPTEMFPMSKPEDEEESLEGFGGLDQLETDTDDDTDSDDESLLADTEI